MITAAVVMAAALQGCVTSSQHVARYRPSDEGRQPWSWEAYSASTTGGTVSGQSNSTANLVSSAKGNALKKLRRGDKVVVNILTRPEPTEIKNEINDFGALNLPMIGTVKLEGMTTAEAEKFIQKAYKDGGYYNKIDVIVMAQEGEYYIQGEINKPGVFPLSGDVTLLMAIATAGGPTDWARESKVQIRRGTEMLEFDVDKIKKGSAKDPYIQSGDIIIIPRKMIG